MLTFFGNIQLISISKQNSNPELNERCIPLHSRKITLNPLLVSYHEALQKVESQQV